MKKAFILGAGLGTRLRPLTANLPKPLVPVFNRPMVEFALDSCIDAGIEEFAINTHHCPEAWNLAFPDSTYRGCKIDFFHESTLLETGGGLKNISDWIGEQPVLVHNGDILSEIKLDALIAKHRQNDNEATLALRSTGPACVAEFNSETEQIVDLKHELGIGPGTHQFTGIYCLSPALLKRIPRDEVISVRPALIEAAANSSLGGICLDEGNWVDLGTIDTYLSEHLKSTLRDRISPRADIDPSARLDERSWVGPLASIGANCTLTDCIVWPGATVPADTKGQKEVFQ